MLACARLSNFQKWKWFIAVPLQPFQPLGTSPRFIGLASTYAIGALQEPCFGKKECEHRHAGLRRAFALSIWAMRTEIDDICCDS
jgi:hypothetical protein